VQKTYQLKILNEADRSITSEPWSSTLSQRNLTKKTLFGVDGEVRSKKDLTEPALLEMSGYDFPAKWPL
jgi:hypothetical protein